MPADPTGFDHFRRGAPIRGQKGANPVGFDHFRRGEPLLTLVSTVVEQPIVPAAITGSSTVTLLSTIIDTSSGDDSRADEYTILNYYR